MHLKEQERDPHLPTVGSWRVAATILVLSGMLALVSGCDREGSSPSPRATSPPRGTETTANQTATNSEAAIVYVSGGRFVMGEAGEVDAPPHEVVVSPFYMDRHLVTQSEYERVMGENPSRWKGPSNPVEQIRWSDAVRFCNKRSQLHGLQPAYDLQTWACSFGADGFRLPTEAEWEYACRAGTTTAYFFGDDPQKLRDYAWFNENAGGRPRPVGQKQPNPWGLYDICGNVWEWCNDFYDVDYYKASPGLDPRGPDSGSTRVVRGGAWRFSAERCRSAYRHNENPGYTDVCFGYDIYGFRCVRKAPSHR